MLVFTTSCLDSNAQSYSTPATSTDAAEFEYRFEREQNKKSLQDAKAHLAQTKQRAQREANCVTNKKEPITKRAQFVRAAQKK
jgi:hypothetical protein